MTRADISHARPDKGQVYLGFYNFQEAPFSFTPDPEFLFLSKTHRDAIDRILYGVKSKSGFILLTGEVGTGKTMICRSILDILDGSAKTVYIINPSLTGKELISSILDDLGIKPPINSSKKDLINHLNHSLLLTPDTTPVVIIIDDAQTMPVDALEDLRLLSNLETHKEKLLQIILVGQPELKQIISRSEIRQLKQRISINCCLEFLTKEEVYGYISRRLFVAGDKGYIHFTQRAIKHIYRFSGGIPRLINKVCDYALTAGYVTNDFEIGPSHVKKALTELGDLYPWHGVNSTTKPNRKKFKSRRLTFATAYGLILLIMVFSLGYLFYQAIPRKVKNGGPHPSPVPPPTIIRKGIQSQIADAPIPDRIADKKGLGTASASPPGEIIDSGDPRTSFYALHLGSYKTLDSLMKAVSIHEGQGITVHWSAVDLEDKGTWYRLFTGRFKTRDEAEEFKRNNQLTGSIALPTSWTSLTGRFEAVEDSDPIRLVLQENRYDAHALKTENGYHCL
ncbi:MAG: AAA family ATPase [Thermodesulfobacteriota bacterium]|nr:AAA family ATPase [Thermodesulfobacteriota bacterium]